MLMDLISKVIEGNTISQLSQTLGADPDATSKAVSGALPVLVGALSRNASSGSGAESLLGALQKDHDGSILDNIGAFLGGGGQGPGDGILKHVLGGSRQALEQGLSASSGLDLASTGKLLAMLAPLVMGGLGKIQREQGLSTSGLSQMLGGELDSGTSSAASGLLSLLDSDADGSVLDDLADLGSKFLGGFGRK